MKHEKTNNKITKVNLLINRYISGLNYFFNENRMADSIKQKTLPMTRFFVLI